jgi:hypothetical protein
MYPIQIREGHGNGPEIDFTAAVRVAMGTDERVSRVVVTAVYAEDVTRGRVTHQAGDPIFAMDAEVHARRIRFGEDHDAEVSMAGPGAHSPEVAMARAQAYMLAAQIAAAANAAAAALAAAQAI